MGEPDRGGAKFTLAKRHRGRPYIRSLLAWGAMPGTEQYVVR